MSQVHKVSSDDDWEIVATALDDLKTTSGRKVMHKHLNPAKAFRQMRASGNVWFVDGYLVYYGVTAPWYSDVTILHELLVVRVGQGGTLRGVTQFLQHRANITGAQIVAVGTALSRSDRALSRLYQAEGFTPEAITLTMEA